MENYQIKLKEGSGRRSRAIHVIQIPDKHPRGGWYRQMTSLSGFRHRATNRWYDYWHNKHYDEFPKAVVRFHNYDEVSEQIWKDAREKHGITDYPVPQEIHHESLWDFYDSIGYNHKNKSVKQIDELLILGLEKSDHVGFY